MRILRATLFALTALAPVAATIAQDKDAGDPTTGERKLATIPNDLGLSETTNGPDGAQYTSHTKFVFGAGGKFVAYTAFRDGKPVAIAGDEELGEFHYLHQPVVDPNGLHYAFRAGNRTSPTKEDWWAIVDGEKGKPYAWISSVAINSDGDAMFWEQPGAKVQKDGFYNQSSVVFHFGKKKGKKFDSIGPTDPVLSADGQTAATVAMRGREWFAITRTSKKESVDKRGYPMIEDIALSPDGKRTAVMIFDGGQLVPPGAPTPPGVTAAKLRISVDGKIYGDDTDGAGAPVFAPKGKRFAFKFVQGGKMGLALDNEKLPDAEHDFIGDIVFDAKGTTVAYAANTGSKVADYGRLLSWGSAKGGTWSLYTRKGKDKPEAIVEGVDGIAHVTFGPDGQLVYAQQAKGRWYMMVGDRRSEGADEMGQPWWSEDGTKIEFGARNERELWWKILELK